MTKKNSPSHPAKSKKTDQADFAAELAAEREAKLRIAAEYANFQKRAEAERAVLTKHTSRQLLENLFPVIDNFYRASTHAPEVSLEDLPNLTEEDYKKIFNYFSGLRLIERQLEQVLGEMGLRRIPTVGLPFDHNLHEAISHEPSSDVPADHIIAEVESGWSIDDKAVKPAKVRVSQG